MISTMCACGKAWQASKVNLTSMAYTLDRVEFFTATAALVVTP